MKNIAPATEILSTIIDGDDTHYEFTKLRHLDFPKMGKETIKMTLRGCVWVYPELADPYSPLGVRIVPTHVLKDWGIPLNETHKEAYKSSTKGLLADYCEAMKDHEPSGEELYEMRAAFGEGEKVVNVITGKVTQL